MSTVVERHGDFMKFYKTCKDQRTTYTYTDAYGHQITLRVGDTSPIDNEPVTEEMIKFLNYWDDSEVCNNWKNGKPPLTDEEKAYEAKWEAEHPGKKYLKNWNMSLDVFVEDSDNGMDWLDIMANIFNGSQEESPVTVRFYEVLGEMPEKMQRAYRLVEVEGYSMTEVAKTLGCSVANISKLVSRAKAFIRENY